MKKIILKALKAILICFLSIFIIYSVLTINMFLNWCKQNQIILFKRSVTSDYILDNVDKDVIDTLGKDIEQYAETLEESKNQDLKEILKWDGNYTFYKDGKLYSYSEYYNSLGFSVWSYMTSWLQSISISYVKIAITWGIAITIFYIIISSKINYTIKFAISYFGIIIFIRQMYEYTIGDSRTTIESIKETPLFYIIYTIVFFTIYFWEHKKYKKMAKEVNDKISQKEDCPKN